jgi:DNA invertase Pin-like site-specific DNA recombinase
LVVIVSAIAELERNLIIERVRAGMRRAKLAKRAYTGWSAVLGRL